MVADDGRIIPFRHVKGIVLTLIISLVITVTICAGLLWLLTKEKMNHHQTREQLSAAKQAAARYKSDNEIATAELVLAEARLQKAGGAHSDRDDRARQEKTDDHQPASVTAPDGSNQTLSTAATQFASVQANRPFLKPQPPPSPEKADADTPPKPMTPAAASSAVALGKMVFNHDPDRGRVTVNFRISNTGLRSASVEGWCVVALKGDPNHANTWIGMPDGSLMNKKIDFKKGKNFKISNFIDMDMQVGVGPGPLSVTNATVYIFDDAGSILLEKDFSISQI